MTTEHPGLEQLSRLVDGDLAARDAADVERHLAACPTCSATLARLHTLLGRAAALPRSIDPPPAVWRSLRRRLGRRGRTLASTPAGTARRWGLRAAAVALLVAGSSAVTTLVLRSRTSDGAHAVASRSRSAPPGVPAGLAAVERSYGVVVEELTATLESQRGALAPETIATVERTLRVIDGAIAEARAALAADPANGALLDVLSANYEQKVHLLRRASELPART